MNDRHIQIFDGSHEYDSDSCVVNNFFDVRRDWIFTRLFVLIKPKRGKSKKNYLSMAMRYKFFETTGGCELYFG